LLGREDIHFRGKERVKRYVKIKPVRGGVEMTTGNSTYILLQFKAQV